MKVSKKQILTGLKVALAVAAIVGFALQEWYVFLGAFSFFIGIGVGEN